MKDKLISIVLLILGSIIGNIIGHIIATSWR